MASTILPTRTDSPHYDFTIELDGANYVLEFKWNDRAGAWFFTLSDEAENVLIASRKVVLGYSLLSRFASIDGLPAGAFLAIDTSGTDTMPGLADLGDRVQLVYVDAADVASV